MLKKRQTIRDHTAEANLFSRRAVIALGVVALMLLIILNNLYDLQVNQHEDYTTRSNGNRIKILPIAPNRGLILDRNGVILAANQPVYSLVIIPEQVDDVDGLISELGNVLEITEEDIEQFYKDLRGQRRFKPVTLKNNLTAEEVALFSARKHRHPGVDIKARLSRYYPFKETLTHVIGYVAKINKRDLQKIVEAGQEENYAATHDIGKLGIEKYHEEILHGQVGYQQVEVNNQGRIIRILNEQAPVPGKNIVLNIDVELQLEAQRLLQDKRGTIIVSDPNSGGILAMYSSPSYDPNLFVHGISSRNYSALLNSPGRPLINRATQGQYPPASTIKPHLGLAGLDANIITAQTSIRDYGRYSLPNVSHVWRDWKKGGHGEVNVSKAIEVSCDTFYYDLAFNMGIDLISEKMYEFGFGDFTGIDLYEESNANMPSRGWKRARFNQPWYIGDTIPVGIGQSYWTATPIQLNQSVNILINEGARFVPQIMRGVVNDDGTIKYEGTKSLRPITLQEPAHWKTIQQAMHDVVHGEHGTARYKFNNTPYESAGKTGTAQLFSVAQDEEYDEDNVASHLRDNAMYVGYAPFDDPLINVTVVLENAGGGSSNAAPIARSVMDYFLLTQEHLSTQGNTDNAE